MNYLDGMYVSASPAFVSNIVTVDASGALVSMLEPPPAKRMLRAREPNFGLIVQTNPRFVASVR